MKTLVISILVFSMAFFSLIPAFGQPPDDEQAQPTEQGKKPAKETEYKKTADANETTDVNTIVDANKIADTNATANVNLVADANMFVDPNTIKAEIEKFAGLDNALNQLNIKGSDEIREWTRDKLDDRLDLALAMQAQIATEFKFLRELAVKENAKETVAAIDGILLNRQNRFKSVLEELEKNNRRLRRRAEREERRSKNHERSRERNSRERSREHIDRNR